MDKINTFINRLSKIGIDVVISSNIPWIYLDSVNGKKVKEKFESNHRFTIAFRPAKLGSDIEFTDISEIFKIIRKYKN